MGHRTDGEGDLLNSDRDQPVTIQDAESRWVDDDGSNTLVRPAERIPVGESGTEPDAETTVASPAPDT